MRIRWRRVIAWLLGLAALALVAGVWTFWPLIVYTHPGWHRPTLYRRSDVPARNRGAVATAIVGATVVDGTGGEPIADGVIVLRGPRIVAVGRADQVAVPHDAMVIDGRGKTILPGLIDMHVHLSAGDDLPLFLAAGVTTVRDVGNFISQVVPLAEGTSRGDVLGPQIFFSGESFIHRYGFAPWQRPTADAAEARAETRKRIASGASVIKIVSDITSELVKAIVDEAHRANVPVTADILGNNDVTAERAIALGVDGLEHVSGVPQSIQADDAPTRSSEVVSQSALLGWLYADPRKEARLIDQIVQHGTYVVPTFVVMRAYFPADVPVTEDPAVKYVSRSTRALWTAVDRIPDFGGGASGFLVHFMGARRFVARLDAAGGRIVAGTDTPTNGVVPGFSLHSELKLLVESGLTPMHAIVAATRTAAEFLGKADEIGTVTAGKVADLVIVNGAPQRDIGDIEKIEAVVHLGDVIQTADIVRLSATPH
jgi:imidazolonepropionase-like amidohydrolase